MRILQCPNPNVNYPDESDTEQKPDDKRISSETLGFDNRTKKKGKSSHSAYAQTCNACISAHYSNCILYAVIVVVVSFTSAFVNEQSNPFSFAPRNNPKI